MGVTLTDKKNTDELLNVLGLEETVDKMAKE